MKQDVDDKTIDMFGAEGNTIKKRMTLSISADAGEKLRALQGVFERGIGFEPSLAQIVEHLINEYSNTKGDKMTPGHSVESN
jgi:hypothetical protein